MSPVLADVALDDLAASGKTLTNYCGFSSQPASRSGAMPIRAGIAAGSRKLHVVQASILPTRNQVLLGDYLRGHPDDVAWYGALKRRLAALHDAGGDDTRATTDLIQELTDKARAGRGLWPAPVCEE